MSSMSRTLTTERKRFRVLPFDDSVEGISGNTFDVYIKPYVFKAYMASRKGATSFMRLAEFKTEFVEDCVVVTRRRLGESTPYVTSEEARVHLVQIKRPSRNTSD